MAAAKKKPAPKKPVKKVAGKKKAPAKKPAVKKSAKKSTARKSAVKTKVAEPTKVASAVHLLVTDLTLESAEGKTLGAIALNLAALLDAGAGMASAAVARELRETIDRMCALDGGDNEDAFAEFTAQLNKPG